MSIQNLHGQWGEDIAATYLQEKGLEIVERNWRFKKAEIDLVARDQGILVFVEVKTRAYTFFGQPEEMVDRRKKRLLIDAAMAYMRATGYDWEIRFDIVSVVGRPDQEVHVTHFKDAFFPGLDYLEEGYRTPPYA